MPVEYRCHCRSYVGASYVKWVEAAGGRVAPIRWDAVGTPLGLVQCVACDISCMLFGSGYPHDVLACPWIPMHLPRHSPPHYLVMFLLPAPLRRFYASDAELYRLFKSVNGLVFAVSRVAKQPAATTRQHRQPVFLSRHLLADNDAPPCLKRGVAWPAPLRPLYPLTPATLSFLLSPCPRVV